MYETLWIMGNLPYELVQDFFHEQYFEGFAAYFAASGKTCKAAYLAESFEYLESISMLFVFEVPA